MQQKAISNYQDLILAVKQLSIQDLEKLNNVVSNEISAKRNLNRTNMQSLILKAPIWTEEDYGNYLNVREEINRIKSI
jgi:hypothetical protein